MAPLFLVSHDRAFLDNVVTQVIAADGDGSWGNRRWLFRLATRSYRNGLPPRLAAAERKASRDVAPPRTGVSFRSTRKRELETLPDRIRLSRRSSRQFRPVWRTPVIYQQMPQEVPVLNERLHAIDQELEAALERWEVLETKAGG